MNAANSYNPPRSLSVAGSIGMPPAAAPRELHVPSEMAQLRAAVDALNVDIGNLASRLYSAGIVHSSPGATETGEALDEYRVPLAGEIRDQRRRLEGLSTTLQDLQKHLEL